MGGVGAVAPKPTQTELVRSQENKQGSTTSKIKETLKNIFGAKKAKAATMEEIQAEMASGDYTNQQQYIDYLQGTSGAQTQAEQQELIQNYTPPEINLENLGDAGGGATGRPTFNGGNPGSTVTNPDGTVWTWNGTDWISNAGGGGGGGGGGGAGGGTVTPTIDPNLPSYIESHIDPSTGQKFAYVDGFGLVTVNPDGTATAANGTTVPTDLINIIRNDVPENATGTPIDIGHRPGASGTRTTYGGKTWESRNGQWVEVTPGGSAGGAGGAGGSITLTPDNLNTTTYNPNLGSQITNLNLLQRKLML